MRLVKTSFIFFFWGYAVLFSQPLEEKAPPDYIKTIIFKGVSKDDQFPIIAINESFLLEFDDLRATEADYYYEIVHCDYNWNPSNILKSNYLIGFDGQRIATYQNSMGVYQSYTHYQLQLPTTNLRFKISGNYMIKVLDDNSNIIFTRRFIIYENDVKVEMKIKQSRTLKNINSAQVINFEISPITGLLNPFQNIKVAILKNYRWGSIKQNIKPQFVSGNRLIYNYDMPTAFDGGNEYLFFENKDIQGRGNGVAHVELNDIFESYLFTNTPRRDIPYSYAPDINGDFRVNGLYATTPWELDYANVHFSLKVRQQIASKEIFVVGKFNNYQLSEQNKLTYNTDREQYETTLKLKQGFYNYIYVLKENDFIDFTAISGNFWETENVYITLVYYQKVGNNYDSIIGLGSIDSSRITTAY